jgi:integrase
LVEKLQEVTEQEWLQVNEFNRQITQEFLEQQHLSPHTLVQYSSAIKIFFNWVRLNCFNKSITELKPRDALRYQNFLIARGLSSSAVKLKRSAVSSLCGYIELYYSDDYQLFRNIYNKKIPNPAKANVHKKEPLTEEEFNNLVEELKRREEWQMVAYLLFTYVTGCRRAESAQLKRNAIDYKKVIDPKTKEEKNYFLTHDIRCKGRGTVGKVRRFPFDDVAMEALKKWDEVRGEDDCEFMFVKKQKDGKIHPLQPSAFNYWCQEIFSGIVGRRVHPHLLRSSRATNLALSENKSIDAIQSLLGHNSPDTTKIYIVKENEDEIDELF